MEAAAKLPPEYAGREGCAALGGLSARGSPRFLYSRVLGAGCRALAITETERLLNDEAKTTS
jgi:hypothetical protein